MSELRTIAVQSAIGRLQRVTAAGDRSEIVAQLASTLDVSVSRAYTLLKDAGWSSGRKARCDKGRSALDGDCAQIIAAHLVRGTNAKGQSRTPVTQALAIAQQTGDAPDLSVAQVRRVLRQQGLHRAAITAPDAAVLQRSRHPNHVWFIDISPAAQWYFRDEAGRRLDQYAAHEIPRKPEQMKRRHILRFLAIDHYTGAFFVRYYYAEGETAVDVVDFLWRAMAPKTLGAAYPLRGVPGWLVMDQGSAMRNAMMANLLSRLGFSEEAPSADHPPGTRYVHYHAPGNAKMSGVVETRHRHWQESFEAWLAARGGGRDLDDLNTQAERFAAVQQAETAHSRHGHAPLELWSTIRPEQLVEAPARDVFFALAGGKRETRVCDARLWVSYKGKSYELKGGIIYPGAKVEVEPAPFQSAGLRAWDTAGTELSVTALTFDSAGFAAEARGHTFGDTGADKGASAPVSPAAQVVAQVASGERAPVPGLFDDMEERLQRHAFLVRTGQAWTAPAAVATEPVIGEMEAREWVAEQATTHLGRRLTRQEWAWWGSRLAAGLTRSALDAAWAESLQPVVHVAANRSQHVG